MHQTWQTRLELYTQNVPLNWTIIYFHSNQRSMCGPFKWYWCLLLWRRHSTDWLQMWTRLKTCRTCINSMYSGKLVTWLEMEWFADLQRWFKLPLDHLFFILFVFSLIFIPTRFQEWNNSNLCHKVQRSMCIASLLQATFFSLAAILQDEQTINTVL